LRHIVALLSNLSKTQSVYHRVNSFKPMKQLVTRFFYSIALVMIFATAAQSQLVVTNNMTIEQYVQDVLLGQNVSVSNITYNGGSANSSNVQVGGFECPDCNLGIESGYLMSTGSCDGAQGPNTQTGYTGASNGLYSGTDPDLVDLVTSAGGSSVNDWIIIEFDFIPLGDTIRFNYVWSSDEYDSYANSSFNDVFGFFISGPGINGSYQNNADNIALIPGTTISVGINTINNGSGNAGPCEYCEYYNQDTPSDGYFWGNEDEDIYTNPYYMQYDGYTDVLEALAVVQCGQEYHIKLAICDSGDGILDSGVFLESESFSSNLVVQVAIEFEVGGPDGNVLFEDCGDAFITFARPQTGDVSTPLIAYIDYSGTAIMDVDYTTLPDSVVFDPYVMEVSFPLDAFEDGISEGVETVYMDILNFAQCAGVFLASNFEFEIWDTADPLVVTGYSEEICLGASIDITPTIEGGYGNYSFDWSTGENTQVINVMPDLTTTYNVIVNDTCGMPSDDADITIVILDFPNLEVTIDSPDLELNCGDWLTIFCIATGGNGDYDYFWSDEDGNNLWGWENSVGYSSWNGEGEINVEVTDGCGFVATDVINVTLNVPDMIVDVPTDIVAPCGLAADIEVIVSGGSGPYWYTWYIDNVWQWDWDNILTATYSVPSTVMLQVGDNCGQLETYYINVTIDSPPIELELIDQLTGNCLTEFDITPDVSAGSGTFSYSWTEGGSSVDNGSTLNNFQSDTTTTVNLLVTDACGATATDNVIIEIINPEVLIEVGEDITSSCITTNTIDVEILSGAGGYSYLWYVDGTQEGTGATFDIQTYETAEVSVLVTDACNSSDDDAMTITIPDVPIDVVTSADTSVCVNGSAQVWALATGGEGGFTYDWTPGGQNGDVLNLSQLAGSNTYTVIATDICGDEETASVEVIVMPITADFTAEEIGASLFEFIATPEPACNPEDCQYTYLWDFGDDFTAEGETVEHQFDGFAQYTTMLTVVNEIGCTSNAYYLVTAPVIIYIPNSFTPNGDGINDVWLVQGANIREFELLVFNRWGDVVFQTTDVTTPWIADNDSGEYFVPNGVYNYLVKVKGYEGDAFKKSGSVTVMR